ncbi:chemotaxis protein CheW [Glaciimonas sp. CA11.2]|uniref:chemotaxis protein CheW n=1 Tax=Glaciimonas sp. CA11.2 TaxID=3048601 RepID=UPI002AB3F108|nr:chemotaxis protein CheW [Glaciimonas sp. CA11.2]MDY7548055.1 chemotaxis protein CheW [Glaciimonas sp. CA11.2]
MMAINVADVLNAVTDGDGEKFLVFTLGAEEYGIDILRVQEIRNYEEVTRIPHAPTFIKGVSNLRGIIVPIVDFRIKLKRDNIDQKDDTVVIILNIRNRVVGILVDGVSDVLTLTTDQIRPAPEFCATLSAEYLTGLGALEDRMLILLDIEKLMCSEDMALFDTKIAA